MEKKVTLENFDILKVEEYQGQIIVNKAYMNGGIPKSIVTLSMSDDFRFEVFGDFNEEIEDIRFPIPKYDPLYKHLCSVVGDDEELVIDDDNTNEEKRKYMSIKRENGEISINFHNDLKGEFLSSKFSINVVNIERDGRSKIDQAGQDTKEKLVTFFRGVAQDVLHDKDKDDR